MTTPTQEWIFVFGHGQRLRSTSSTGRIGQTGDDHILPLGLPLWNRYVAIPISSFTEAQGLMVVIFGDVWSVGYVSREAAGVDEYGLVELDLSEVLAEIAKVQR